MTYSKFLPGQTTGLMLSKDRKRSIFMSDVLHSADAQGLIPFGCYATADTSDRDKRFKSIFRIRLFDNQILYVVQTTQDNLIEFYFNNLSDIFFNDTVNTLITNDTVIKVPSLSTATATYIVISGKLRQLFNNVNYIQERVVTINGYGANILNILYINGVYVVIGDDRTFFFTNALSDNITVDINTIITLAVPEGDSITNAIVLKNTLYVFTKSQILVWKGKTSFQSQLPITYMQESRRNFVLAGQHALITVDNVLYALGAQEQGDDINLYKIDEYSNTQMQDNPGHNFSLISAEFSLEKFSHEGFTYIKMDPLYSLKPYTEQSKIEGLPWINHSPIYCPSTDNFFLSGTICAALRGGNCLYAYNDDSILDRGTSYRNFFYESQDKTWYCLSYATNQIVAMNTYRAAAVMQLQYFPNIEAIMTGVSAVSYPYRDAMMDTEEGQDKTIKSLTYVVPWITDEMNYPAETTTYSWTGNINFPVKKARAIESKKDYLKSVVTFLLSEPGPLIPVIYLYSEA